MVVRDTPRRPGARRTLTDGVFTLLAAVLGTALGAGLVPAPALADGADLITITGEDLPDPVEVAPGETVDLFQALLTEVDWLAGREGEAGEPEPETLGPKFTVVVNVEGEARHRYDLYPLADGGPRAYRPAEQPGEREVRAGWFFGRLTMPRTLTQAGVLTDDSTVAGGGIGGGSLPRASKAPPPTVSDVLTDWREGMRLTVAVTVLIMVGLGAAALLIRRRI